MNRTKIFIFVLAVTLHVPYNGVAQRKEQQARSGFVIEVDFPVEESDKTPLYIPQTMRRGSDGQLFIIVKARNNSQSPAFKIVPRMEGNSVQVEVSALFGNLDNTTSIKQIEQMKQEAVASYVARYGEVIQVSEVRKFGAEPLKVRVVRKAVNILPSAIHILPDTANSQRKSN